VIILIQRNYNIRSTGAEDGIAVLYLRNNILILGIYEDFEAKCHHLLNIEAIPRLNMFCFEIEK